MPYSITNQLSSITVPDSQTATSDYLKFSGLGIAYQNDRLSSNFYNLQGAISTLGTYANVTFSTGVQLSTANTAMKSYVDSTITTANTAMKSYVDDKITSGTSGLNTKLDIPTIATTQPTNPYEGLLWFDKSSSLQSQWQLKVYVTNVGWVPAIQIVWG